MSGYSEGGASLNKKTLKNWMPRHLSAISDIENHLNLLRNRSFDLATNSPLGAAIINTLTTGVIGQGLRLFPRPRFNELGMSAEQARAWSRKVKSEFGLWSGDCDYLRRNSFEELQRIGFQSSLADGDCFCLIKRELPNKNNPYSLRLQLVESARVSNPIVNGVSLVADMKYGANRIVNGVEVDRAGRMVAFHISNRLWNEVSATEPELTWQRVKIFGEKTGCRNVLQICTDSRPDNYRGVSVLAPVIEGLKQLSRYVDAELTAAIIRSFFSLFVVQPASNLTLNEALGQRDEEDKGDIDISEIELGSGTISALPKGCDVKAIDSQHSQNVFANFVEALTKEICAAVNLPYEVVIKNFTSSYAASRAALLQAQNEYNQRKAFFITDFLKPIYEQFLSEAVATGRIDAPGYFDDANKKVAYLNAEWYTPTSKVLDVTKETNAAIAKLESGLSTYEKEIAEMSGEDFEEVIEKLSQECELLPIKKEPAQAP
ncbi:MAG: phage portal protein [Selenomonadaceae bacterium]|nr:phage portal protein [Selenomonadaceae bacterium]